MNPTLFFAKMKQSYSVNISVWPSSFSFNIFNIWVFMFICQPHRVTGVRRKQANLKSSHFHQASKWTTYLHIRITVENFVMKTTTTPLYMCSIAYNIDLCTNIFKNAKPITVHEFNRNISNCSTCIKCALISSTKE